MELVYGFESSGELLTGSDDDDEQVYKVLPEKLNWMAVIESVVYINDCFNYSPFIDLTDVCIKLKSDFEKRLWYDLIGSLSEVAVRFGARLSNERTYILLVNLKGRMNLKYYKRAFEREIEMTLMARIAKHVLVNDPGVVHSVCILCGDEVDGNPNMFRTHQKVCEQTIILIKNLTLILLEPLEKHFEKVKKIKFHFLGEFVNYQMVPTNEVLLLLNFLSCLLPFDVRQVESVYDFTEYFWGGVWLVVRELLKFLSFQGHGLDSLFGGEIVQPQLFRLLSNRLPKLGYNINEA